VDDELENEERRRRGGPPLETDQYPHAAERQGRVALLWNLIFGYATWFSTPSAPNAPPSVSSPSPSEAVPDPSPSSAVDGGSPISGGFDSGSAPP
jgi:hypothetical protein